MNKPDAGMGSRSAGLAQPAGSAGAARREA